MGFCSVLFKKWHVLNTKEKIQLVSLSMLFRNRGVALFQRIEYHSAVTALMVAEPVMGSERDLRTDHLRTVYKEGPVVADSLPLWPFGLDQV
jgi:hypothetical protein